MCVLGGRVIKLTAAYVKDIFPSNKIIFTLQKKQKTNDINLVTENMNDLEHQLKLYKI